MPQWSRRNHDSFFSSIWTLPNGPFFWAVMIDKGTIGMTDFRKCLALALPWALSV